MAFESWKHRVEELEAEVYTLYLAFRDPRTPRVAKVVIVLIVAYAVSPIDLIPDFIPGLGYLDEVVVLAGGVAIALRLLPDEIVSDCRDRMADEIEVGRARWIVAGIVILIWAGIGAIAIRPFLNWL